MEQEKVRGPFLEFTEDYLNNLNIKNIEDFINKGYFKNRNVLCNE